MISTPHFHQFKQKIHRETLVLDGIIQQIDLSEYLQDFLSNTKEYIFLLAAHRTFPKQTTHWDTKHISTNVLNLK